MKFLVMQSSPLLYYPCLLRPKHLPQYPILEHLQSMFLPQCGRPSFTPIQNNRQNYSCVDFNIYIFGCQCGGKRLVLAGDSAVH